LVNTNRIELVGTEKDYKSVLGTVGLKGSVDYTIVGGQIVVENGKLKNINEEELVTKANIKFSKLHQN
jgi:hypothetical protein